MELSGPRDWSAEDVAAAFAEANGRPVATAFVPRDQRDAVLAENGVPAEVRAALLDMHEGVAAGRFVHEDGADMRRGTVSRSEAVTQIVRKPLRPKPWRWLPARPSWADRSQAAWRYACRR